MYRTSIYSLVPEVQTHNCCLTGALPWKFFYLHLLLFLPFSLPQYFQDANEADAWMNDKAGIAANQDYGRDEDAAVKALKKHKVCATYVGYLFVVPSYHSALDISLNKRTVHQFKEFVLHCVSKNECLLS